MSNTNNEHAQDESVEILDEMEVSEQNQESTDEFKENTDAEIDAGNLVALSQEALIEIIEAGQAQMAEMKDGVLRAKAEMENIRRRSQNEVIAARKFAIEGFAQEVLAVKDNLDRAASVELEEGASTAVEQMKEGLSLTLKQLDGSLSKFAVTEIEAAPGIKFDPEQHQAISMIESKEIDSNHIISVMQPGFKLKDRLLRPAMVVVAS